MKAADDRHPHLVRHEAAPNGERMPPIVPDRRAAARRLIASSVVYAASVVAEFIRLGIAGVTPLAAMPFASIIPAGILLVWLVLLGVVTLAYRAWVRRLRRPRRGIPLPPSPPRSTME